MRWRSIVALALLMGYGIASAEVIFGEVRDGAVHHESAAEALNHAVHDAMDTGEHGHEDAGEHPEHGPDHQHGTSADHCTHAHSVGLPGHPTDFSLVILAVSFETVPAVECRAAAARTVFHPPKA